MNVHDPYTVNLAASLKADGRAMLYICYAVKGCPSNAAPSYPGFGKTPRSAALAACYWVNQAPWVRVVPWRQAPRWAIEAAQRNIR